MFAKTQLPFNSYRAMYTIKTQDQLLLEDVVFFVYSVCSCLGVTAMISLFVLFLINV